MVVTDGELTGELSYSTCHKGQSTAGKGTRGSAGRTGCFEVRSEFGQGQRRHGRANIEAAASMERWARRKLRVGTRGTGETRERHERIGELLNV